MAFHVSSKFRTLRWISNLRVKPTSKAMPFLARISRTCYSTGKDLPRRQSNSKLVNSHRANNPRGYFNSQIKKHGNNGNVREAEKVFARITNKDVSSWTSMLAAYAKNGEIDNARKVFDEMPKRDTGSYNVMITAYGRLNRMADKAFELFSTMPERNAASYGAMISGFVRAGMFDEAEKLFSDTPIEFRDPVCSSTLCRGYLNRGNLDEAYRIFNGMAVRDVVSWSSMVDGYCKAGRIVDARGLFDAMPERNVVTWTSIIDGYVKDGNFEEGFDLFLNMRREGQVAVNSDIMTVMFGACGRFSKRREGFQIHGLASRVGLECEGFLGNSMVNMYCRFGDMVAASKIFNHMVKRDLVSWDYLTGGYVQCGDIGRAFEVFERMPKKNASLWTNMVSRLFRKGLAEKAVEVFEMIPEKDSEAWTTVIMGFMNSEEFEEAFRWFHKMLRQNIVVNSHAFSRILDASAGLGVINQGTQIHAFIIKKNMESDLSIQNALVSMYSSCGCLPDARAIFVNIESPNTVSFNSMITGFAQNGFGKEADNLFSKMCCEKRDPNEVTFLGILSACVRSGLVEEGLKYFKTMKSLYGIAATPDHYVCVVDLLGRAGLLDEATALIRSMPFKPSSGVWESLLHVSKTHSRLDLAKLAAQKRSVSELDNTTEKLNGIIRKSPGCSWIVLKDKVHLFVAGDRSHVEIEKIEVTLQMIQLNSRSLRALAEA